MECNQGAVRPVMGKKSSCILSCGKGYRLWVSERWSRNIPAGSPLHQSRQKGNFQARNNFRMRLCRDSWPKCTTRTADGRVGIPLYHYHLTWEQRMLIIIVACQTNISRKDTGRRNGHAQLQGRTISVRQLREVGFACPILE